MESKPIKILFAGGGTGGHLFPALAVADAIRSLRPGSEILFVGTKKKIEARVVPARGYTFRTIWISGFHRSMRLSNVLFPLKAFVACMQSFIIIKNFKPNIAFGTGGYVAGPVLFAASVMGIPTFIHESNSIPGVTTKLLSSRVNKVLITYDITRRWLKRRDNVELVGNPTRRELGAVPREEAAKFFGHDPTKKTLLVFGGSLGAASLNRALSAALEQLTRKEIQIIWQTGEKEYESYVKDSTNPPVWIGAFIDKMEYAYAAADLVVCRAGATTLAELTRLGKPAVLIPYPYAAGNHQVINARTLVDAGAAVMIDDRELSTKFKEAVVSLIVDDTALKQMGESSRRLGRPDAGKHIAEKIMELAQ